ncbi:dipeptidyl peptidase IV N-terminal region-domain-containing protein [Globomyces pollinis-pini]|nr:dipeptidyl peptidase IV N-terminal region-domain-containing protein [Globomyces pollinis-pini]
MQTRESLLNNSERDPESGTIKPQRKRALLIFGLLLLLSLLAGINLLFSQNLTIDVIDQESIDQMNNQNAVNSTHKVVSDHSSPTIIDNNDSTADYEHEHNHDEMHEHNHDEMDEHNHDEDHHEHNHEDVDHHEHDHEDMDHHEHDHSEIDQSDDATIYQHDHFDNGSKEHSHGAISESLKPAITKGQLRSYYTTGSLQNTFQYINNPNYPDGTFVENSLGNIQLGHVEYGNKTIIAKQSDFIDEDGNQINYADWSVSYDLKRVLLVTAMEYGWRHSFYANYWVYDVEKKKSTPLTLSKANKTIDHDIGNGKVALALWGPKGHNLAWIRDNDVYLTIGGKELQVTFDGSKDIINGISDWVYEEEVLASHQSTWFSLDGNAIAFIKYNETLVPDYQLQYYEKYQEKQYPEILNVKYPKPGAPNPIVSLHVAYMQSGVLQSSGINFGEMGFLDEDRLITEVNWIDGVSLFVRLMNRVQDIQRLFLVELKQDAWIATLVREEATPDGAWHNHLQPLRLIPSAVGKSSSYIELMDHPDGYAHIAYFKSLADKKPFSWLTSGKWEVSDIKGIDIEKGVVYYLSTQVTENVHDATQRHLYSVSFDGDSKKKLTPWKGMELLHIFATKEEDQIGFYDAHFSPKCTYVNIGYTGPDMPWQQLHKLSDLTFSKHFSKYSQQELLSEFDLPKTEIGTIPNGVGGEMNAKIIYPPHFNVSKQYPVLMNVYGGPNSQQVTRTYKIDFMTQMAAAGFIVLIVDGRGTGFNGREYRSIVSKQLGLYETQDQITAAQWAANQTYVDSKRIGIWGWSYGGYMTSKIIEADSGVFSLGMAVAPVTDWKFYDSVYTERYMKTPQKNPEGYKKSAVAKMNGFRNAKFLLVHGTADVDNVHFQNSAALVWHLTGAGVGGYTVQYYTDSDHSMGANGARTAVYEMIEEFVCKGFNVDC